MKGFRLVNGDWTNKEILVKGVFTSVVQKREPIDTKVKMKKINLCFRNATKVSFGGTFKSYRRLYELHGGVYFRKAYLDYFRNRFGKIDVHLSEANCAVIYAQGYKVGAVAPMKMGKGRIVEVKC